jgi:hypothetical protein
MISLPFVPFFVNTIAAAIGPDGIPSKTVWAAARYPLSVIGYQERN